MARYTTQSGVCSVGDHKFEDKVTEGKGYLSPNPPKWDTTTGRRSDREKVCRKHYLEQYKEQWPDADLSKA